MARWAISVLIIVMLPAILGMTSGKIATIRGTVVLNTGAPASGALVIVKDSWAGSVAMQEREITRVTTDQDGNFFLKNIAYRHTLDLLVPGKECFWWTGNGVIIPSDRDKDGVYNLRIELLKKECKRP